MFVQFQQKSEKSAYLTKLTSIIQKVH